MASHKTHNKLNDQAELVLQSVITKTRAYFTSEHGIDVVDVCSGSGEVESLVLLDMTAVICMGGRVNMLFAFSFQECLVNSLYEWMTSGLNVSPNEINEYREAAVGEFVNTILGLCTMDFQHLDKQGISLSPPIVFDRIKKILGTNYAVFYTQSLDTVLGRLDVSLVGTRELFATNID